VHLVDAEPARHRFRRGPAIAGEHDDSNPGVMQKTNGLRRRWLDRVGDADQARQLFFDGDEHHRLPFGAQPFGSLAHRVCGNFQLFKQFEISQRHSLALDDAKDTLPRIGLEALIFGELQLSFLRAGNDGRRQRMLTRFLQTRGQAQDLRFIVSCERYNRYQTRLSLRERAGLIHDQRIDLL